MVAIPYRMGASYPGEITRSQQMLVEPLIIMEAGQTGSPTAFGVPIIVDTANNNKGRLPASGELGISGILVRDWPSNSISNDPLDTATPLTRPGSAMSLLKHGYCGVTCSYGTPVKEAPVYLRSAVNGGRQVGAWEATPDGTGASAATAGNTGNGTMSAITLNTNNGGARPGAYRVVMTAATTFNVFSPNGVFLGSGTTGSAFARQIGFTITAGGTPFVAGDSFTVTLTMTNYPVARSAWMGGLDASNVAEMRYNMD